MAGKSKALLIVKTPGSRGPVRVSNAPTTISDVAATVLDAAGVPRTLPGEPALKLAEDAQRVRALRHVRLGRRWLEADLFRRSGYAGDSRTGGRRKQLEVGRQPLSARRWRGQHARAVCTRCSEADPGSQYRWSSPHGFFHAPPQARSFEIEIRSIAPKPQTVTFAAAGRVLDTITLSDQAWVTVKGALPSPATPATNWLELHVDPPWRPRGEARHAWRPDARPQVRPLNLGMIARR